MSLLEQQDFFISYNHHDRAYAEWIAGVLENAGYSTLIQAWDFRPGGNFVLDMHEAIENTKRTIAVLSPNYLESEFTQPEWAAAFVQDPRGKKRTLIPVRVETCTLTGLLRAIVYVDLVGKPEAEAEELLLREVSDERRKPADLPPFPKLGIPANLPHVNPLFVGREEALQDLHHQLQPGQLMAISSIQGMGGIGKTELALHYALNHLHAETYPGGVCWLRAREDVGVQILRFAREKLGLVPPENLDLVAQVTWCWQNWQSSATLIVLDDVQAYGEIKPFLPQQYQQFRVLLTTRKYLDGSVKHYEIRVLTEAASLDLLRRLVSDGRVDQDLATAKQVCEWLGYLPLGLELVGRYLARKKGTSLSTLWERLQAQKLAARALLETETGMTATLNVTAAFELSWQELNENAQLLAKLLSLFALAEIPWSLVQRCLPESDEEDLEDLRDLQLVNLSLLSFEGEGHYQLHQLLREFFAAKLTATERKPLKTAVATVMIEVAKQIPQDPTLEQIQAVTAAIPHLKEVATDLQKLERQEELYLPDEDDLIWVFMGIILFYQGQGLYTEAEPWAKNGLAVVRSLLGEQHPDVATSLSNLAELYRSQGRYEDAEPLFQQALQLGQTLLGEQHPNVAASLNNLAALYRSQGRYEDAEPLYQRALQLGQTLLGEQHPDVATSLNNLASLYESQGRYEDAEPLYQRALQLYRTLLGEQHPNVAMSLNNLAGLYYYQGRYEDAEPLYQQALQLRRSILGEQHPDVATSLNNLAALYQSQGRYEDAEPLYQQALQLRRSILGEQHPNVAASLNNLALLYYYQGRYEDAEPLYQQALQLCQTLLGEQHPDVAASLNNLAGLYRSQGHYEEAEPLYQQALQLYRTLLGEQHPNVAMSLNNLALLYQSQGRYEDAEPLFQQALQLYRTLLGEQHPNVAVSLNNLAVLYAHQGRFTEAEPLLVQALERRQQLLGTYHPDTIGTQRSLEALRQMMG